MQPYQQASETIQRQNELPLDVLKTLGKLGATALGTAGAYGGASHLIKQVTPFLSKYIPQDIATKALSKIDPRFGNFINKSLESGASFDEVRDFIKEKAEKNNEKDTPQENRNIIQKYSDELDQFIKNVMKNGNLSAQEAGTFASSNAKFKRIIDKMVSDYKTPFSSIIENSYGSEQKQNPSQQTTQETQQNQQPGQGQQALMELLQKIKQSHGVK